VCFAVQRCFVLCAYTRAACAQNAFYKKTLRGEKDGELWLTKLAMTAFAAAPVPVFAP
jgi:hypothetical protein